MINGYAFVNNKLQIDLYRFSAITKKTKNERRRSEGKDIIDFVNGL